MPGQQKGVHERGQVDLKGGVWRGSQNPCDMERELLGDEGNTGLAQEFGVNQN